MQNEQEKKETEVLDVKVISFGDTKIIENKDGTMQEVSMYIPACCREGWPTCPHVAQKHRISKRNVGL